MFAGICADGASRLVMASPSLIVDRQLFDEDDIYFGGGDHRTVVHLTGGEFRKLSARRTLSMASPISLQFIQKEEPATIKSAENLYVVTSPNSMRWWRGASDRKIISRVVARSWKSASRSSGGVEPNREVGRQLRSLNCECCSVMGDSNRAAEGGGGLFADAFWVAEASDMSENEAAGTGLGRHRRGFERCRVHQVAGASRGVFAVSGGTDRVAHEQVGCSRAGDDVVAGKCVGAEREYKSAMLDAHGQSCDAMDGLEERHHEAADVMGRACRHGVAADVAVRHPFGKAPLCHGCDAGVSVGVGVDLERHVGEQQCLHAAGMIEMTMGNDHVADVSQCDIYSGELTGQLKAAAGVDQQRRAALGSDEQTGRGSIGHQRRACAEECDIPACVPTFPKWFAT